ncbi:MULTISPECIES: arginase [Halocynthiibacter]|uniref:Arginase n=1 Tax=Halocynthiibacter halioticoli TaxID=2986804 RepID=A0AAE3IY97_9RHOB|nr:MULTISPECIES: arginase [Halocynthiibacter]MCV6824335.1 arginase [Halocynthiibacter halioticoli]MCW4057336.1 arginase [Halocynthiibacter sp. SDUM655004]
MEKQTCHLIGAPVDCGKARRGCVMGPDAFRVAGLDLALKDLGHEVEDWGNLTPQTGPEVLSSNPAVHGLTETIGWSAAIREAGHAAVKKGTPVFLGGDHAISLGSVAGIADYAQEVGRPLFLLWLDAHTDIHTLNTTTTGNLHGTPVAYAMGLDGFEGFAPMPKVPGAHICYIGLRSVDPEERKAVAEHGPKAIDMRYIDEHGIAKPLGDFLRKVAAMNGLLHVSLDVDFLDPSIAPAVGTTVPGGATIREAHLAMEMICDSGLMTSLDLVELNPFLDDRGRTAEVMVDLTASLFGRRVFDRDTVRI